MATVQTLKAIRRSSERLVSALERQNQRYGKSLNVQAAEAELRALLVRAAEADR